MTGVNRQIWALVLSPFVGQRLTTFISKENHADLETLSRFIEAGQLRPILGKAYPLAEAADATRHLEAGQARDKIAITV